METNPDISKKFKYCFIMRGLPGSGKSTVARQIAGSEGVVHSLDKYLESKLPNPHTFLNQHYFLNLYPQQKLVI